MEVDAAYYGAPPGWIGRHVQVQWDSHQVRLMDPQTGQLLREHLRQARGRHRIKDEDRPKQTPLTTLQLLSRADKAGAQIGALCRGMHQKDGETAVRRILGVLSLAKKYGGATVEDACAAALEVGVRADYHFVRRYLERHPQLPLSLRQVDPLIRQLTLVPRLHRRQNQGEQRMNLIELQRALRQLRLGGIAAVLETRLRQAQAEAMAPIDLISCLVSDELTRRSERLLDRRRKQAAFRDPHKTLDNFDFTFNPKMNRSLVFDLATCAFIGKREDALFLGPGGTGKSHLAQAIGQAAIQQGYRVIYRETHVLLDELAEAVVEGTRKQFMESVATVPLLIIDDFGMRKLPPDRGRGSAGDHHAALRAREHAADFQPTRGGLGETAGRCGRRHRHARPHAASRTRAQVRPTQLAHQDRRTTERRKQGRRLSLDAGLCPKPLGFIAFPPEWLARGGLSPPRHSGRWIGARVASLRCRILRPGGASIDRGHADRKKKLPNCSSARYK